MILTKVRTCLALFNRYTADSAVYLKHVLFKVDIAELVRYPLFSKPVELDIFPGTVQQAAIARLIQKQADGSYRKVPNSCLCGNLDRSLDELVSRIDMHGIPLNVVLCRKCGLIRSAEVFDGRSNADYYRYEYRDINSGGRQFAGSFFTAQLDRGEGFLKIIGTLAIADEIDSVMEIGCGSGGVLYPFHQAGKSVCGFDYDEEFLRFGRARGMDLHCIAEDGELPGQAAPDLLILSHVFEHFLHPKEELIRYLAMVNPGRYLLIEVPGIFSAETRKLLYGYPVRYFQVAHVFQFFYYDFLVRFFASLGLEIVYGDECATFVLRKPLSWSPDLPAAGASWVRELAGYPALIDSFLKEAYFDFRCRPDREKLKSFLAHLLDLAGIREKVEYYLKKWRVI